MSETNLSPGTDNNEEGNAFLQLPTQTQGLIIGLVFVLAIVALVVVRGLAGGDEDGIELDAS